MWQTLTNCALVIFLPYHQTFHCFIYSNSFFTCCVQDICWFPCWVWDCVEDGPLSTRSTLFARRTQKVIPWSPNIVLFFCVFCFGVAWKKTWRFSVRCFIVKPGRGGSNESFSWELIQSISFQYLESINFKPKTGILNFGQIYPNKNTCFAPFARGLWVFWYLYLKLPDFLIDSNRFIELRFESRLAECGQSQGTSGFVWVFRTRCPK